MELLVVEYANFLRALRTTSQPALRGMEMFATWTLQDVQWKLSQVVVLSPSGLCLPLDSNTSPYLQMLFLDINA